MLALKTGEIYQEKLDTFPVIFTPSRDTYNFQTSPAIMVPPLAPASLYVAIQWYLGRQPAKYFNLPFPRMH